MKRTEYRRDIDALRGVAVLLVVLYHAFPGFLPGGYIGVDVFFVISGYLITGIIVRELSSGRFSFADFYSRRIRRIFPSLLFVLSVSLLIGWLVMFPDELERLGLHVSRASLFILNFTLIEELGYFDVSSHYKPLLHLWTLSIEEQYYLLWPLVVYLLYRSRLNLIGACAVLVLLSFLANLYFVSAYRDLVFFHSLTRFWELGLGSLLALLLSDGAWRSRLIGQVPSSSLFLAGVSMILLCVFLIDGKTLYPGWYGLLPTVGAMLVILANVQASSWWGLVHIGLISYPLYLWHWVVISFLYIYLGGQPGMSVLVAAVFISYVLALFTNRTVERIRYRKSRRVIAGLVSFGLVTCLGGVFLELQRGYPQRGHLAYVGKYQVEFERTPPVDDACDTLVSETVQEKRQFHYCRSSLLNNNRRLVAVIGDSHAHALFPGISEIAHEHGYDSILLANSGCPLLKGFLWGKNEKEIESCQNKIDQILAVVQKNRRIEKVIFTTRGPTYIHGEVEGRYSMESVTASLKQLEAPGRLTYEQFLSGYEKTLGLVTAPGHVRKVYYYLENPELDFLPKEVIPRPFDFFRISAKNTAMDRELHDLRMQRYRELILEKGTRYPTVSVIDVTPYLCDGSKCDAYRDGNFLYADDDHLSVYGSRYIAKKTEERLFGSRSGHLKQE